jgi:predicted RNase H-like HicB family nuclease
MGPRHFRVTYKHDGAGWLARVPDVDGCFTQGATVEQARERVREALAVALDDDVTASAAVFDEEIG